ncbi:MAG: hypothetical protein KAW09_02070 [Thermoplasmata archaeon]|nr:hypothetical protein [Thermoplasmata archaeon]
MGGFIFGIPGAEDYECEDAGADHFDDMIESVLKVLDPSDHASRTFKEKFYDPYQTVKMKNEEEYKKKVGEGMDPADVWVFPIPLSIVRNAQPAMEKYIDLLTSKEKEISEILRRAREESKSMQQEEAGKMAVENENLREAIENAYLYGAKSFLRAMRTAIEADSEITMYYC